MTTVLLAVLGLVGFFAANGASLFIGFVLGSHAARRNVAREGRETLRHYDLVPKSAPEKRRRGEAPNQREAVH